MIRQIFVPTENTYILHLPDDLIGKKVELIAFSSEDIASGEVGKKTIADALAFYNKNSIDFSNLGRWKREDLYE